MPSQLYLSSNARNVFIPDGEYYRINPQPGATYDTVEYRLMGAQSTLEFGTASLGLNARITLPVDEHYTFTFNAQTGQIDISLPDGHVLAALPVDSTGTAAPVRIGEGEYAALQVDPETLSVTPSVTEMLTEAPTVADKDFFALELEEGQHDLLQMMPDNLETADFDLYDPQRYSVDSRDDRYLAEFSHVAESSDTYYLEASELGDDDTGNYSIPVSEVGIHTSDAEFIA